MRLTIDVIKYADRYINAIQQREISLRGYQIPSIENMGILKDSYDSIDLSNNSIMVVDNFPPMKRLNTLLLHSNKINKIGKNLGKYLPNIENLMLNKNSIQNLSDLDGLEDLPTLLRVSLQGNPVTKERGYRLYVIVRLPNLKHLDFKKERKQARELFSKTLKSKRLSKSRLHNRNKLKEEKEDINMNDKNNIKNKNKKNKNKMEIDNINNINNNKKDILTEEQREMILKAIESATTTEETDRLEKILNSGQIPNEDWKKLKQLNFKR